MFERCEQRSDRYREFRSNKENFVGRMDIERERKRGEGVREPFPEEPYCSPVVLP